MALKPIEDMEYQLKNRSLTTVFVELLHENVSIDLWAELSNTS
jgi:hypothetical protein